MFLITTIFTINFHEKIKWNFAYVSVLATPKVPGRVDVSKIFLITTIFVNFHEKIKWNSADVLVLATPKVDISKCFLRTKS